MGNFVLPPKSEVGYLDPEIAGEGQKIILSDGDVVNWSPPPEKPVAPDWSKIKTIAKYFNRIGFVAWPAWLYHPTEPKRIVKNAQEAAELGVCYREATPDERQRYGLRHLWDWKDDSKWRPEAWPGTEKFDPAAPGHGKNVIFAPQNPVLAQHDLVAKLIPEVAAAVAKALKGDGAPSAPAKVDPAEWEAFQQFLAFKKSAEAVNALARDPDGPELTATGITEEQDRSFWIEEAVERGVKIDKRWSVEKIRAEIEKAAA